MSDKRKYFWQSFAGCQQSSQCTKSRNRVNKINTVVCFQIIGFIWSTMRKICCFLVKDRYTNTETTFLFDIVCFLPLRLPALSPSHPCALVPSHPSAPSSLVPSWSCALLPLNTFCFPTLVHPVLVGLPPSLECSHYQELEGAVGGWVLIELFVLRSGGDSKT